MYGYGQLLYPNGELLRKDNREMRRLILYLVTQGILSTLAILAFSAVTIFGLTRTGTLDHHSMLAVALAEARQGLAEGGIPIGAAIFDATGRLIGKGHNRRVQSGDPSLHGETDAFRNAGRQRSYRNLIMVTTLAPCWYCSGLVRQFGFGTVVVGESRNFQGGVEWLRSVGVKVVDLDSEECAMLLSTYIVANPSVWNEDIGEE
jgi:cytosine deaminase